MFNTVTINITSMFKDLYICLKKLHDNVMLGKKIKKHNLFLVYLQFSYFMVQMYSTIINHNTTAHNNWNCGNGTWTRLEFLLLIPK